MIIYSPFLAVFLSFFVVYFNGRKVESFLNFSLWLLPPFLTNLVGNFPKPRAKLRIILKERCHPPKRTSFCEPMSSSKKPFLHVRHSWQVWPLKVIMDHVQEVMAQAKSGPNYLMIFNCQSYLEKLLNIKQSPKYDSVYWQYRRKLIYRF